MGFLTKLFLVNVKEQDSFKVIKWWETRRFLFNVLIFVYFIHLLTAFSDLYKKLLLVGSLGLIAIVVLFLFKFFVAFLGCNFFYFSGWTIQLMLINSKNIFFKKVLPFLFMIIVVLSFVGMNLFLTVVKEYINIDRQRSETKDEPVEKVLSVEDFEGEYYFQDTNTIRKEFEGKTMRLKFNSDSTFELINFPSFDDPTTNTGEISFLNGKGQWRQSAPDFSSTIMTSNDFSLQFERLAKFTYKDSVNCYIKITDSWGYGGLDFKKVID